MTKKAEAVVVFCDQLLVVDREWGGMFDVCDQIIGSSLINCDEVTMVVLFRW